MPPGLTTTARRGGRGPAVWLGVLCVAILGVVLLYGHWAQRVWYWQPDELEFRVRAEFITRGLPESLWGLDNYGRGIQRLTIWELAGSLGIFGAPDGFRIARWIQVVAFASAAFPTWLWARSLGASRPWAGWSALLAIAVPWAVVGATFLTEPIAYPLAAWASFATWRAAARPSAVADVLAIVAIGAATLARTGFAVLALVLVSVCLLQELRIEAPSLRRAIVALGRKHAVLCVAVAAGLVFLLAGYGASFTGVYADSGIKVSSANLWDALTYTVAIVGAGVAFVPVVAALALGVQQLVKPTDRDSLALGLVVLGLLAALVLTVDLAPREERYVFFLVPVCAVVLARAVTRRDTPLWSIVVGAVLLGVAVLARDWRPELGPIGFIAFPAETFHARVVLLGAYNHLPHVLQTGTRTFDAVLVAGAAVVAALFACRLRRGPVAPAMAAVPVLAAGLLAIGLGQAVYSLSKFELAVRGVPLDARTWADRAAHGKAMGVWLPPLGPGANMSPIWEEERYFNVGAGADVVWDTEPATAFPGEARIEVRVDRQNGRLVPISSGQAIPQLILVPRLPVAVALRATLVAQDSRLAVDLLRFQDGAPSVRWLLSGADADGWVRRGATARVRVFAGPRSGTTCVQLGVAAPPDEGSLQHGTVTTGGHVRRFALSAARPWSGSVPVRFRQGHADITVHATGSRPFIGDRVVSARVAVGEVGRCSA